MNSPYEICFEKYGPEKLVKMKSALKSMSTLMSFKVLENEIYHKKYEPLQGPKGLENEICLEKYGPL